MKFGIFQLANGNMTILSSPCTRLCVCNGHYVFKDGGKDPCPQRNQSSLSVKSENILILKAGSEPGGGR